VAGKLANSRGGDELRGTGPRRANRRGGHPVARTSPGPSYRIIFPRARTRTPCGALRAWRGGIFSVSTTSSWPEG
jgi:hypothetical protein